MCHLAFVTIGSGLQRHQTRVYGTLGVHIQQPLDFQRPSTFGKSVVEKSDLLRELRIDRSAAEEPSSRRPVWIVLGIVVTLVIAAGIWFAMSGSSALPVHTAVAQPMPSTGVNASVLDATGYVTARRQATVSAQITGTLTEVLIEEGEHVESGQVLGRLEDTAQRAALAQAQAQLQAAQALLVQYQAQLAQSRRDLQRNEDMVGRKLVSQQAVEQAKTLVETGSAQLQAQSRQVELAQAGVQSAQVQLGYCTVRAPFTGVVIAKAAQVGEIVSPFSAGGGFTRTGIGTIVDMDSLEVEVDVNEAYINRVQPNQPVDSVLNAYPDWKIPSHVIAIIPTADRSKATVKVRIAIEQKDNRIVPDMGVRVSFLEEKKPATQTQQAPRGVLVPATAVRKDGDKDIVFVLKDGKAQRRAVSLGGSVGDSRQVQAGVSTGESVIVDAPDNLKDGMAVTVVKS
jgi:RND family efflux transporter MFP subunit